MKPIRRAALAMVPLSETYITEMYEVRDIKEFPQGSAITAMRSVCESHERLRAEVEGAEVVINDYDAEVKTLRHALKSLCEYAAASREANTKEFMQELADHMNAAAKALKEPTVFVWHHDLATGELWFTTRSIP